MGPGPETPPSGLEIIRALAPDIHARLKEGHKLNDIWHQVVSSLPAERQLTVATFKKYWQLVRHEIGLAPMKTRSRQRAAPIRTPKHTSITAKHMPPKTQPVGGFREDPEDI
jgi:hypothetical protein